MSYPPQLWDGVVRRLEVDMPTFTVDAWVRPLTAAVDESGLTLFCPSAFHVERLRDRFLARIRSHADCEAGKPVPISLRVGVAAGSAAAPRDRGAVEREPAPQPVRGDGVSKPVASAGSGPGGRTAKTAEQRSLPYTFDSFVVGPCNALAREASYAIARGRHAHLNLLYLKGDFGLGKTHLARAIVGERAAAGGARTRYATAEGFTNDFMSAIRGKSMEEFKRRYRRECALLVLEDVPFLTAKKATQLELFHTLMHLLDAGRSVVLTGTCLPRDIAGIDPRLASQMTAGLVAEIEPPDARVRRRILRSKAARGGVRLPADCLDLLVERARGSVRELEGVLIQLVSTASLLKRTIDVPLTEAALRKLDERRTVARRVDPRRVIEVVAAFFQTRPDALASRSRRRDVLVPRQLAMYLCRRFTDHSNAAIAAHFGRNHTAVANAERVVARQILERAPLRYQVEALCDRLEELEQR